MYRKTVCLMLCLLLLCGCSKEAEVTESPPPPPPIYESDSYDLNGTNVLLADGTYIADTSTSDCLYVYTDSSYTNSFSISKMQGGGRTILKPIARDAEGDVVDKRIGKWTCIETGGKVYGKYSMKKNTYLLLQFNGSLTELENKLPHL